jgi:hypothetical protein
MLCIGVASKIASTTGRCASKRSRALGRFGGNVAKQWRLCAILPAPFVFQFLFTLQNAKNEMFEAFFHP